MAIDYQRECERLAAGITAAVDSLQRGYSPMGARDGLKDTLRMHRERVAGALGAVVPPARSRRARKGG